MKETQIVYVKKSPLQVVRMGLRRIQEALDSYPEHYRENGSFTIGLIAIYVLGSSGLSLLLESLSFEYYAIGSLLLTFFFTAGGYGLTIIYDDGIRSYLKCQSFGGKVFEVTVSFVPGYIYFLPFVSLGMLSFEVSRMFL